MAKKKSARTISGDPAWPFSISLERLQRLKSRDLHLIDVVMEAQVACFEAYEAAERKTPLTAAQRVILQNLATYRKAGEDPLRKPRRPRGKPALRLIRGGG